MCAVSTFALYHVLWTGRLSTDLAELLSPIVRRHEAGKLWFRRNRRYGDDANSETSRTVGRVPYATPHHDNAMMSLQLQCNDTSGLRWPHGRRILTVFLQDTMCRSSYSAPSSRLV